MNPKELVKKLAMMVSKTNEQEFDCDEVHDLIDEIAEMQAQGVNWGKDMPLIQAHIAMCGCCNAEFDVLLTILEGEFA